MADKPNLSDEMKKMEYEPLLPAEKKLIVYNLLIGSVLLFVLVWVSHTFFPITQMQAQPEAAQTAGQKAMPGAPVTVPAANTANTTSSAIGK